MTPRQWLVHWLSSSFRPSKAMAPRMGPNSVPAPPIRAMMTMSPDVDQCRMPELMKNICDARRPPARPDKAPETTNTAILKYLMLKPSWLARSSLVRIATMTWPNGELRIKATSASMATKNTITYTRK